jgi:hypothetical protein
VRIVRRIRIKKDKIMDTNIENSEEKVCSLEYFCEMCDYYPLYPVHGHYECPQCRYKTKCCEGAPQDV